MPTRQRPVAVDLFSGSGAVSAGLSPTFEIVAAVDNDSDACQTYRANHPKVHLFERDITNLAPEEVILAAPRVMGADLLVVCAPCQPFSNQNRHKGTHDGRTKLVLQAARFAKALRPKLILFENVPGLVGASGVRDELGEALTEIGYHFGTPLRLDAADLGVPQRRVRCVMFAARTPEAVDRLEKARFSAPASTVADAIGHLPKLRSGETDPGDPMHHARAHSVIALSRLAAIPHDGGSRDSLPAKLRLRCHLGKKGYPDVYGRMSWGDVAPTLTTGCTDITKGRFAHPDQDRAITVREAALLQSFPPEYAFCGSLKTIARQIGNAVPPAMVARMVPALVDALEAA